MILQDGHQKLYTVTAGYIDKTPLKFGERTNYLFPFCERYAFFSPAILYLWGRFTDAVLIDFLETIQRRVEFYHYKFNLPLFQNLNAYNGDPSWNHVLWAVEKEFWPQFIDHLCAAVLTDSIQGHVYRIGYQEFQIVDPLCLDRSMILSASLPLVTIGAFGVVCDKFSAALDFPEKPSLQAVPMRLYPADEKCQQYADILFKQESLTGFSDAVDRNQFQEMQSEDTLPPYTGNEGRAGG